MMRGIAASLGIFLLVTTALSAAHEGLHMLAAWMLGGRVSLVVDPSSLTTGHLLLVRVTGLGGAALSYVALAGSMSLALLAVALAFVREVRSLTEVLFTSYAVAELVVNLFTDLGDGLYLATPKLGHEAAVAAFWVRVLLYNLFLASLTADLTGGGLGGREAVRIRVGPAPLPSPRYPSRLGIEG